MFTEAQNFSIVQTELDAVFFQRWDAPETFPGFARATTAEIFKPIETTHAAYIQSINKGSGLFPKIGETVAVPMSVPRVTNKQTTTIATFAQGINISKQLFDDNMHGVWAEDVKNFAMVARLTQDQNAFGLFRGGFTTTLTADGVSWFNSAHPLIGGGTQSNTGTGALTPTTLNDAVVNMAQQKDQSGVIVGNTISCLIVPVALWKKATEITDSALIADSGNNNLNVYRSAMGMTVYTSPYLGSAAGGSDTAWFVLAQNHGVRRLIRQGVETALVPWQYSNNLTYTYQANFREEVFVADYAGSYGSTGTA